MSQAKFVALFKRMARHLAGPDGERRGIEATPAAEVPAITREVAEGIYRAELRRGAWAVDLGIFGPQLFVGEAAARLRAIELGDGEVGPPTP
jgi:hypothetical protein